MRSLVLISAAACLQAASAGVTVVDCPKCERFARYADDGKSATVNRARLVGATPAETESAITAAVRRAEAVLASNVLPDDAVRPLMGWSSWNCFALEIDEEKIVSQARVMATNGLKAAGYRYVNTDDGFFDGHDEKGNLRWNLKRFPKGMKPVVDGIHACGLKAGVYSDAGADMCGGSKGSGLYGHDAADCDLHFRQLGFDYIKVDYCGGCKLHLNEEKRYTEISKAIRATGRDVKFNVCRWAYPGTWISGVADSWRVTGDIRASWKSVRQIVQIGLPLSAYASRGHYNDLDMLEVGHKPGWKPSFDGDRGLSHDEEISHFGLWCILSSPLVLGCDLRELPREALELVTNPYLLAMNANDLGLQAYPVRDADGVLVLVKDAGERYGLSRYVAVVNLGDEPTKAKLSLDDVDLAGRTYAVDLVGKAEVGSFEKDMELSLKPHEGRFYRLFAEKRLPRRVYRADSAWMRRYHKLGWSDDAPVYHRVQPGPGEDRDALTVATGLGRGEENDLLWRDVRVDETRTYRLTFTVLATDPRSFTVSIDGVPVKEFDVPARRWTQDVSCDVELKRGSHEVRVSNAWSAAPAFARMTVGTSAEAGKAAGPRETVVYVSAHPDDLAGSVGTVIRLADRYDVHVIEFTHGERGLGEAGLRDGSTAKRRTAEDEAVCRALGVKLHWCDEIDGEAFAGRAACERIAALYREIRPRAIIVHSLVETHNDHMMSASAAIKAAQLAGISPEIYFQEQDIQSRAFQPVYWVDVSALTERRREVISLWACQDGPRIAERKIKTSEVNAFRLPHGRFTHAEVFGVFPGTVPPGKGIFDTLPGVMR